jgi:hypothetical protein
MIHCRNYRVFTNVRNYLLAFQVTLELVCTRFYVFSDPNGTSVVVVVVVYHYAATMGLVRLSERD